MEPNLFSFKSLHATSNSDSLSNKTRKIEILGFILVQALMPECIYNRDRKCTGQRVFYSPNNAQGRQPECIVWTVKDPMPVCIFGRGCKCTRAQCLYILISHFEVKVLGLSDHFHFYLSIVMRPWAYYCNKPQGSLLK